MRKTTLAATFVYFAISAFLAAFELPQDSRQCLLGVADGWDSSAVTLRFFEKEGARWSQVGGEWKGRLGKRGLVWGLGLHPVPENAETKREGDLKSPAGVFKIGGAWGYAADISRRAGMPYAQITSRDLWVEDPDSPLYNRHIRLKTEPESAWEKKQQMKQGDPAHSLKLFIAHNAPPAVRSGAGSSIFFHIWRAGGAKPTAGCTTMSEENLRSLIAKIDPEKDPVFVLLPLSEYERLRAAWKLP